MIRNALPNQGAEIFGLVAPPPAEDHSRVKLNQLRLKFQVTKINDLWLSFRSDQEAQVALSEIAEVRGDVGKVRRGNPDPFRQGCRVLIR